MCMEQDKNLLSILSNSDIKPFITGEENWSFLQDIEADFDVAECVRTSWMFGHLISTYAPSFDIKGPGYAFQARYADKSETKPDIVLMSNFLKSPPSLDVVLEYSASEFSHIDAIKCFFSEYRTTRFLEKNMFSYERHRLREVKPSLDFSESKALKGISYWKPYEHQEEIIQDLKSIEKYVK